MVLLFSHKYILFKTRDHKKKDAINKFGIKYLISNPVTVKLQEPGSSLYVNIEKKKNDYWWENTIFQRMTGPLSLHLDGNRAISLKPGQKVAHFACFGEP
jgi:hypothetical protein